MSDFYTSYETSLALRDAGAPQGDGSNHHWRVPGEFDVPPFAPWLGTYRSRTADVRAFRADEIIESIRADGAHAVDIEDDDEWVVRIYSYGVCRRPYEHESLVEALAQAWLAVLKEVKRG